MSFENEVCYLCQTQYLKTTSTAERVFQFQGHTVSDLDTQTHTNLKFTVAFLCLLCAHFNFKHPTDRGNMFLTLFMCAFNTEDTDAYMLT